MQSRGRTRASSTPRPEPLQTSSEGSREATRAFAGLPRCGLVGVWSVEWAALLTQTSKPCERGFFLAATKMSCFAARERNWLLRLSGEKPA
mmetsp:Transcript_30722/g.91084  ORF Transcript_30722/g.91084 Transcript_30722/m.91084 type:complete len:91 (-) Transcript_30722:3005-3277(-)